MNCRELLLLALEALELEHSHGSSYPLEAIDAIRAHLSAPADAANPEPSPVAWQLWKDGELYAIKYEHDDRSGPYAWVPLYTKENI